MNEICLETSIYGSGPSTGSEPAPDLIWGQTDSINQRCLAKPATDSTQQTTKKPAQAGFYVEHETRGLGGLTSRSAVDSQRLDSRIDTALVPGGFVFVNQATSGITVENRHGGFVSGFGRYRVIGLDGLKYALDGSAQHGALAGVARIANHGLLGALFGGLNVGHVKLLKIDNAQRMTEKYAPFGLMSQFELEPAGERTEVAA